MRRVLPVAAAVVLLSAIRVSAGVTIVIDHSTSSTQSADTEITVYIDGDRLRIESPTPSGASVTQWDNAKKTMRTLDPSTKSYVEMGEQDFEKIRGRLQQNVKELLSPDMKQKMEQEMQDVPPEERKKVLADLEKMAARVRQAQQKQEWSYEKIEGKDRIGGYSCDDYNAVEKTAHLRKHICAVPWDESPVSKDEFKTLTSMGAYIGQLGGLGGDPMFGGADYPGFPVAQETLDDEGDPETREIVKSAKKGSLDDALFRVPAGYTKRSPPEEK
jgi:hypothetical protein